MADTADPTFALRSDTKGFIDGLRNAQTALTTFAKVAAGAEVVLAQFIRSMTTASGGAGRGFGAAMADITGTAGSMSAAIEAAAAEVGRSLESIGRSADETAGKIKGALSGAGAGGGPLDGLSDSVAEATDAVEGEVKTLGQVFEDAAGGIKNSIFSIQSVLITLGAGALFKKIIEESSAFGQSLAYVGTVLTDTSVPLEKYKGQLLDLAGGTSKDLVDLTRGLYQTISSGIPATEGAGGAFEVLEASQRAAVAGMATTEEAVKAITGVMNAYAKTGLTAAEVSDQLFQTVNRGVIEFPELAQSFGQVSGVAASFGVKLQEVLGAVAGVTKTSVPAAEAITAVRAAILAIAKPTDAAKAAAKDLGIELGAAALAEKGFAGVLEDIIDKTGGSAEAMTKLFTDVDGLKGALALTGQGIEKFVADIDAIKNSAGSTDRAFKILSETFDFMSNVLKNKVTVLLIKIGDKIMPKLQKAFTDLGEVVVKNQDAIAGAVTGLFDAMLSIGRFVAESGPKILAFLAVMFGVKAIAAAVLAIQAFVAALSAAAVAAAAAGAASGSAFGTAFSGRLAAVMKSPGLLGLIAGAGVLIGQAFGDSLGKALVKIDSDVGDAALAVISRNIEKLDQQISAKLKALGFKTLAAADAARAAFLSGAQVIGPDGERLTPKQAVTKLGKEGAKAAALETEVKLLAEVEKQKSRIASIDADIAKNREKQAKEDARAADQLQFNIDDGVLLALGGEAAQLKAARLRQAALATEAKALRAARDAEVERQSTVIAGSASVIESTLAEIDAIDAKADADKLSADAAKKLKSEAGAADAKAAAAELAKAAADAQKRLDDIAAEQARLLKEINADAAKIRADALDAAESAFDEETSKLVAAAELIGATDSSIAQLQIDRFEQRRGFIQREVDEVTAASVEKVHAAEVEFEEIIAAYQDSLDVQILANRKFAQDKAQIAADAAAAEAKILADAAAKEAALAKKSADAAAAAEKLRIAALEAEKKAARARVAGLLGEPATALLENVEGVGAGKGGALGTAAAALSGAATGLLGAAAAFAGPIAALLALPQILDGVSAFLTDGVANFISSLADSLGGLVTAIAEGLPAQLETIFAESIPALIEALITAAITILPGIGPIIFRIVAGIVVGLGRGIASLFSGSAITSAVKSLFGDAGYAFVISLRDGFLAAMDTLFGGAADIIGEKLTEAFNKVFEWIEKKLNAASEAIGSLSGGGDPAAIAGIKSAAGRKRLAALSGGTPQLEGAAAIKSRVDEYLSILASEGAQSSSRNAIAQALGLTVEQVVAALGLDPRGGFRDINGVRVFHQGGMVGAANAFAAAGAPRFAFGGAVEMPGAALRRNLGRVLAGDDIPAILQAGEAVLSRRGVDAAGGQGAVERFNRGQDAGQGNVSIMVAASGGVEAMLMERMLQRVAVSVETPTGTIRRSIDRSAGGAPLMMRFVRGRVAR